MQNRYVGDVGDFGKYGLLKKLCSNDLSLGVVWYLVPDEKHNNDGKHIKYLEPTTKNLEFFRSCDSVLYDNLAKIVLSGEREVSSIEKYNVLPQATTFYKAPLTFNDMSNFSQAAIEKKVDHRHKWVEGAIETTKGCDAIFVDPDNGLQVGSVERHHKKGPKFTFFDEILPYIKRGQSLVIYQHMCRNGIAEKQIQDRFDQIKVDLGVSNSVFALLYRRVTVRTFFTIPAAKHKDIL